MKVVVCDLISNILLAFCLPGQHIPEKPCDRNLADYVDNLEWNGQMNALSKEHMRWGIIYQAAQVSRKPCVGKIPIAKLMPSPNSMLTSAVYEPLTVRQVLQFFVHNLQETQHTNAFGFCVLVLPSPSFHL